jgi:hypothetical protein
MLCIEYDKERKGLGSSHSLDMSPANWLIQNVFILFTLTIHVMTRSQTSMRVLWSGSGHMRNTKHGQHQKALVSYTLKGSRAVGKALLQNISKKTSREKNQTAARVSYFYTFRGTMRESNHSNMLQSILYTILEQDESFFFHFQGHFRQFRKSKSSEWPYNSLKRVLSSLADHPVSKQLYLILDAMDESDEEDRREIIKLLCQLCSREESCIIKIFLVSRPATGLDSLQSHHIITLQEENKGDISRFTNDFLLDLKYSWRYFCQNQRIHHYACPGCIWMGIFGYERTTELCWRRSQ